MAPKTRQNDLNDVQLVDRLMATGMDRFAAEYVQRTAAELGHYEFADGLMEVWMHQRGVYSLIMTQRPTAQVFTYEVTVTVPIGTDAGEPSLEMADAIETVANAHPEWTVGSFELTAIDGMRL